VYHSGLTNAAVLYVLVVDSQEHVCTQLCLQAANVLSIMPSLLLASRCCFGVSTMLTLSRVSTPLLSNTCVTRCTRGTAAEVNTPLGKRPSLQRHRTPKTVQTYLFDSIHYFVLQSPYTQAVVRAAFSNSNFMCLTRHCRAQIVFMSDFMLIKSVDRQVQQAGFDIR
jgi:hypothetical protein